MTLTREQLFDVDPIHEKTTAYEVAVRHAWNTLVAAEHQEARSQHDGLVAMSQAWSNLALVLAVSD